MRIAKWIAVVALLLFGGLMAGNAKATPLLPVGAASAPAEISGVAATPVWYYRRYYWRPRVFWRPRVYYRRYWRPRRVYFYRRWRRW